MPCFHPWKAKRAQSGGATTSASRSWSDRSDLVLPCGQCVGCRVDRSRDWATRLAHEAQLHEQSSFLTLTYSDEHYPADGCVSPRPLQLFMKRARKSLPVPVRFFACGEYGERSWRAHYHVLLFGWDFANDRTIWRKTPTGHYTYRSASLEKLWPFGASEIGSVTTESSGYVARYIMKKVNGENASTHYARSHPTTGELVQLKPEFITMSNRPGIGADWFDTFNREVFPSDFVVIDGKKRSIPRYYAKLAKRKEAPEELLPSSTKVTLARLDRAADHANNNTPERLATREEAQTLRLNSLKRDLE